MQQTVLLRTSRALFIFSLAKAKVQQRSNVTAADCDSLYSSKFPNVFVSAKCICTNSQIYFKYICRKRKMWSAAGGCNVEGGAAAWLSPLPPHSWLLQFTTNCSTLPAANCCSSPNHPSVMFRHIDQLVSAVGFSWMVTRCCVKNIGLNVTWCNHHCWFGLQLQQWRHGFQLLINTPALLRIRDK